MKSRVCVCCGESVAEGDNPLSRNPNICASCSSLAGGMAEDSEHEVMVNSVSEECGEPGFLWVANPSKPALAH